MVRGDEWVCNCTVSAAAYAALISASFAESRFGARSAANAENSKCGEVSCVMRCDLHTTDPASARPIDAR